MEDEHRKINKIIRSEIKNFQMILIIMLFATFLFVYETDLTTNIIYTFFCFSTFSQFHPIIMHNKVSFVIFQYQILKILCDNVPINIHGTKKKKNNKLSFCQNSDFLNSISLQPNVVVVDIWYFKLWLSLKYRRL